MTGFYMEHWAEMDQGIGGKLIKEISNIRVKDISHISK